MALRRPGAGAVCALIALAALAAADARVPLPALPAPEPPAVDPGPYVTEAGDIAAHSFDVPEEEAQAALDLAQDYAFAEGQRAQDAANTAVDLSLRATDRVVAAALRGRIEIPFTELGQLSTLGTDTAKGASAGTIGFSGQAAGLATAVAVQKRDESTAAAMRSYLLATTAADAAQDAGQATLADASALVRFQSDEAVAVLAGTFDTALVAAGTTADYVLSSEARVCDRVVPAAQSVALPPAVEVPPGGPLVACQPGSVGAVAQEAALRLARDADHAAGRVVVETEAFVAGTADVACALGHMPSGCLPG